jgi:hypothetical protein
MSTHLTGKINLNEPPRGKPRDIWGKTRFQMESRQAAGY